MITLCTRLVYTIVFPCAVYMQVRTDRVRVVVQFIEVSWALAGTYCNELDYSEPLNVLESREREVGWDGALG